MGSMSSTSHCAENDSSAGVRVLRKELTDTIRSLAVLQNSLLDLPCRPTHRDLLLRMISTVDECRCDLRRIESRALASQT